MLTAKKICRALIRCFLWSLAALPDNSRTSAVKYSIYTQGQIWIVLWNNEINITNHSSSINRSTHSYTTFWCTLFYITMKTWYRKKNTFNCTKYNMKIIIQINSKNQPARADFDFRSPPFRPLLAVVGGAIYYYLFCY